MNATPDNTARSPAYVVRFHDDLPKSPQEVFLTLKEATSFASSPVGKSSGARFYRFESPKDAQDFLACGDSVPSPMTPRNQNNKNEKQVLSEPSCSYPTVNRIQMNELKRAIEKNDVDSFSRLVDSNPRFLINIGADCATIVMEGFRFNALHIACKSGNTEVVEALLTRVQDVDYLIKCYETSEKDVNQRMAVILHSYLNSPDKGAGDTPLHMAAKFGHVDVVRYLVCFRDLNRNFKNKENKTASEVACARYNGPEMSEIKQAIILSIHGSYVGLYRSDGPTRIVVSDDYPVATLEDISDKFSAFRLAACAGPFLSKDDAQSFSKEYKETGKDVKLSDIHKGYERVGRDLARRNNVEWSETWSFMDNRLVNLNNEEHLNQLELKLRENRLQNSLRQPSHTTDVARKLSFDVLDDEFDEDFVDASENFMDDSLADLTSQLSALALNSPRTPVNKRRDSEDLSDYETPPASPLPLYIHGEPSKVDNDLFLALSVISRDSLKDYPTICLFVDKMRKMESKVRTDWPAEDSPRRSRKPRSRTLF